MRKGIDLFTTINGHKEFSTERILDAVGLRLGLGFNMELINSCIEFDTAQT